MDRPHYYPLTSDINRVVCLFGKKKKAQFDSFPLVFFFTTLGRCYMGIDPKPMKSYWKSTLPMKRYWKSTLFTRTAIDNSSFLGGRAHPYVACRVATIAEVWSCQRGAGRGQSPQWGRSGDRNERCYESDGWIMILVRDQGSDGQNILVILEWYWWCYSMISLICFVWYFLGHKIIG